MLLTMWAIKQRSIEMFSWDILEGESGEKRRGKGG